MIIIIKFKFAIRRGSKIWYTYININFFKLFDIWTYHIPMIIFKKVEIKNMKI